MGTRVAGMALSESGLCSFCCSLPKEFNDPYELFMTIDYKQEAELLAFYRDAIGKLPQLPTTCFSKAPDVVPMWAHYGHDHRGVVLEVDEAMLNDAIPELIFGDIDYLEEPSAKILGLLHRAHGTCKPRHTYFLQGGVFSAAYFTKHTCWSYENERRVIAKKSIVTEREGLTLLVVPASCVTAIISGCRTSPDDLISNRELAANVGCNHYEMRIGRSEAKPFFIDADGEPHEFTGEAIEPCDSGCAQCGEPTAAEEGLCPWCAINDSDEANAASMNPMNLLEELGFLEKYYEQMNAIGKDRDSGGK